MVLVHGAFADSSSWNGVVQRLQHRGYPVIAPANPLRGLASDTAYIDSVLKSVHGPVVLVGHSYGGMLISAAAQKNPQVKALVYVAAFAPDKGESALELSAKFPGGKLGPATTNPVKYPAPGGGTGTDLYIKSADFREVFAGDLRPTTTAAMAATQRPVDAAALDAKFAGEPAWKTIPSWALVANEDNAIPPASERLMATRAHARITEVKASHAVAVSQPDAVAKVILQAARATR